MTESRTQALLQQARSIDLKTITTTAKSIASDIKDEIRVRLTKRASNPKGERVAYLLQLAILLFMVSLCFVAPIFVTLIASYYLVRIYNKEKKHAVYIVGSAVALDVLLCWFFWLPGVVYSLVVLLQITRYVPFWESPSKAFNLENKQKSQ
ncbi:2 TM domain-containing transmembrane protein [Acrasis kona]|uniref:2 TM domain-containing transmembrane protein n=1 Tax=Acrasis kona TaxID=1008807 RepID=A0AAW2ZDG8_9EUKA